MKKGWDKVATNDVLLFKKDGEVLASLVFLGVKLQKKWWKTKDAL